MKNKNYKLKMRIFSFIALSSLAVFICSGCGSNANTNDKKEEPKKEEVQTEKVDKEQIKSDLDAVYKDVSKMDEECQYISDSILTYWDVDGAWTFEGLFDKSYGTSAKQEWLTMRDNVFSYREDVEGLQTSIPNTLKSIEATDDLKEYKDAISDMFVEVNSFATIVTGYPTSYTKITYSDLISEYKTNVEKAKSNVELKK